MGTPQRLGSPSRRSSGQPSSPSPERWTIAVRPFLHRHFSSHGLCIDHWQDVLTGSVLGLVLSYFSYRQYYPSLASEVSHRPYAPRTRHDGPILPVHRPTDSSSTAGHELVGRPHGADNGRYRDSDEEVVPQGTVPRPERSDMDMANTWKDGDADHDEFVGTLHS